MQSLFDSKTNEEIINRINSLAVDSKNEWGKMNVSQMLKHSQQPLLVAFGDKKLKRGLMGILFGNMAKKAFLKPGDFKKNLPTDPSFLVKDQKEFEEEKQKLIELVKRFAASGSASISKDPHPFFGKLTVDEWDTLQIKHLDHHLRQFGV
jgi:hypothetical protein